MRIRRRKRHHSGCGFACDIQALLPSAVAKWNLEQKDFERFTKMGWDPNTNTVTTSDAVWAHATMLNLRCKEFCKKGLDHYELLEQLFHGNWIFTNILCPTNS